VTAIRVYTKPTFKCKNRASSTGDKESPPTFFVAFKNEWRKALRDLPSFFEMEDSTSSNQASPPIREGREKGKVGCLRGPW